MSFGVVQLFHSITHTDTVVVLGNGKEMVFSIEAIKYTFIHSLIERRRKQKTNKLNRKSVEKEEGGKSVK